VLFSFIPIGLPLVAKSNQNKSFISGNMAHRKTAERQKQTGTQKRRIERVFVYCNIQFLVCCWKVFSFYCFCIMDLFVYMRWWGIMMTYAWRS